jgi:deazaflavin-dependent oxidoreductase (nitroreductase family)
MSLKRAVVRTSQKYLINPPVRLLARRGLLGDYVVLETTGRKTGRPRQTPVGMKVDGDVAWMVSEHGRHASYVRNIEADARVRVKLGRRWRSGTAHLVDDDDPVARLHTLWGRRGNTPAVRAMGTNLLSIRIDLDPE